MSTLLVLAILAAGHSNNAKPEKVTFQYNFKVGQTIHTTMKVSAQMNMGNTQTDLAVSTHVDEVKEDGSATLTTSMDSGTTSFGSNKMHLPGMGKKFQMTVSKFGKIVLKKDAKATVVVQEFPDHAIAVGESWDGFINVNGGRTSIDVKTHFTFESLKSVDGHKIAHLLMDEDNTNDKADIKIKATGWLDWDVDQSYPVTGHSEGDEQIGKMNVHFLSDQTATIEQS